MKVQRLMFETMKIEYNSNTSAGHPLQDDDIVRYSGETQRVQDKELEQ